MHRLRGIALVKPQTSGSIGADMIIRSAVLLVLGWMALGPLGGETLSGPGEHGVLLAVATVNGDPITVREFVEALRRGRALHPDLGDLRRVALADCVEFKVIEQLAHRHGLLADASDAALRQAWAQENERRARSVAGGIVIYGPRHFAWEPYRMYWLDDLRRRLIETLAADGHWPDDHQLQVARFTAVKEAAVSAAQVRPNEALIASLGPNSPLTADSR